MRIQTDLGCLNLATSSSCAHEFEFIVWAGGSGEPVPLRDLLYSLKPERWFPASHIKCTASIGLLIPTHYLCMLNMWKVTHCPSHFIYHSFPPFFFIYHSFSFLMILPLVCFSLFLSFLCEWQETPGGYYSPHAVVKLHPEWTSACDGRAAASAPCAWHPCFPGASLGRCPPRSGAAAEGGGGQQTMWVVVHPCALSGPCPGFACRAVFLSAWLPACDGWASSPSFPAVPTWAVKSAAF